MENNIILLSSYESWGDELFTYFKKNNVNCCKIAFRKFPSSKFESKLDVVLYEFQAFLKSLFLLFTFHNNKVLCEGRHHAVLFIYKVFGKFLANSHLFLYNYYIHGLGNNQKVQKVLSFLLNNKRVTMIVQSYGEIEYFRKICPSLDIRFVPYCSDIQPVVKTKRNGYIFSGGYTNRDYPLLLEAARKYPKEKFVFVASHLNGEFDDVPNNVTIYKDIDKIEFETFLSQSSLVIGPLKEDVGSSGQMLCLSAMRNAKTIIYSDLPVINYYFNDGNAIPYKMGNIDSLCNAIDSALTDEEAAISMGKKAFEDSQKYTLNACYAMIEKIIFGSKLC